MTGVQTCALPISHTHTHTFHLPDSANAKKGEVENLDTWKVQTYARRIPFFGPAACVGFRTDYQSKTWLPWTDGAGWPTLFNVGQNGGGGDRAEEEDEVRWLHCQKNKKRIFPTSEGGGCIRE